MYKFSFNIYRVNHLGQKVNWLNKELAKQTKMSEPFGNFMVVDLIFLRH
jgi:hypothetical protein